MIKLSSRLSGKSKPAVKSRGGSPGIFRTMFRKIFRLVLLLAFGTACFFAGQFFGFKKAVNEEMSGGESYYTNSKILKQIGTGDSGEASKLLQKMKGQDNALKQILKDDGTSAPAPDAANPESQKQVDDVMKDQGN